MLIVDDEEFIVEGLAELFGASDLPIHPPYVAYSAQEALAICREKPVDLVVTDIRMPGMSGLDLFDEIRRIWSQAVVIFLTGFAEFEYAKRALSGHAFDYLLKPADDGELLETVGRAIEALRQEKDRRVLVEAASGHGKTPSSDEALLKLLQGSIPLTPDGIERWLTESDLPFQAEDPVDIAIIRIDGWSGKFAEGDEELVRFTVLNVFSEHVSHNRTQPCLWSRDEWLVYVYSSEKYVDKNVPTLQSKKRLEELQDSISRILGIHVSIAIALGIPWAEWATSFRYLASVLRQNIIPQTLMAPPIASAWNPGNEELMGEEGLRKGHSEGGTVARIREYIRLNLEGDLSLDALASLFYLNPTYLSRLFHKEAGESLSSYIEQRKMERAALLLSEPGMKIYSVAENCGYTSSNYFSKVFRKAFGQSPQEYRSRIGIAPAKEEE